MLKDLLNFKITGNIYIIINGIWKYRLEYCDSHYEFYNNDHLFKKIKIDESLKQSLLEQKIQYMTTGHNYLEIHL